MYVSRVCQAAGKIAQEVGMRRAHSPVAKSKTMYTIPFSIQKMTEKKCQWRPRPRLSFPGRANQVGTDTSSSIDVYTLSLGTFFLTRLSQALSGSQPSFQYSLGWAPAIWRPLRVTRPIKSRLM